MYLKLLGGAAVMLIIYLGYSFITGIIEDNATLQSNVAKLDIANDSLSKERDKLKIDLKVNKDELTVLNGIFADANEVKNVTVKIFSDHQFTKLYNKKPTLIIKLINRGTSRVFKEIEDATQ